MKIIDMNIISKYCAGEIQVDFTDPVYVTSELKDEIEIHKASFPGHRTKLQGIKFVDIEMYQYPGGEHFDEAKYLFHYKKLINKYTKITSFYGLKGVGDMSILAAVATLLGRNNPSLFDAQESIEVMTHDMDLKVALTEEFGDLIVVIDPLTLQQ
ncbi:MAG: hypothetical protein V4606_02755 [Patescibacteria group bacterium]